MTKKDEKMAVGGNSLTKRLSILQSDSKDAPEVDDSERVKRSKKKE